MTEVLKKEKKLVFYEFFDAIFADAFVVERNGIVIGTAKYAGGFVLFENDSVSLNEKLYVIKAFYAQSLSNRLGYNYSSKTVYFFDKTC